MLYRPFGSTGLTLSALGFGCGAIGGLMVRGAYPDMRTTVARAIELGVTYFDTASMYGVGQSEVNLGAVLRELGEDTNSNIIVGTKVRLKANEMDSIESAIVASVDASLRRLGRDSVDLIQYHNRMGSDRTAADPAANLDDLAQIVQTFEMLQKAGKVRFWGITALGETDALHAAVDQGGFHSIQSAFNLLNPSAARPVAADFPYQNYDGLINRAAARGMGVIAIRVLAGGALSGAPDRHPVAAQSVNPIASAQTYETDVQQARSFQFLIDEGVVENLVEAAIRFVISHEAVSTALVGTSNLEQLELAATYAKRGPLPDEVLGRL
ncbi:MAG: aldo/keto reductase [Caldilineaceae bacterium]